MTTAVFWKATAERAVKTFAQSAAALLTANASGLLEVDWQQVASVAGLAAVLSLLTSVGSSRVGEPGPSLVSTTEG
jgi:hypothetical protein